MLPVVLSSGPSLGRSGTACRIPPQGLSAEATGRRKLSVVPRQYETCQESLHSLMFKFLYFFPSPFLFFACF